MRRVACVGLIVVLGSVLATPPASATFPGSNGKIAFGAFRNSFRESQIGVIEADGSGRTLLTSTRNVYNTDPAWSRDGSKILFASGAVHRLQKLRTMNADGTGRTVVLTLSRRFIQIVHPSWSPDGSKIAFCAYGRTALVGILTVNADGTDLHRLTPKGGFDCLPDWSPDGTMIAFTWWGRETGVIGTMDADGSHRQLLRAGFEPSWSPDGGQIVFARLEQKTDEFGPSDVFVMNADGTGVTAIANTPNLTESSPTFSPDGTKIAFTRSTGSGVGDPADIWVVTVPGGVFTRLTDTPNRNELGLSWQAT